MVNDIDINNKEAGTPASINSKIPNLSIDVNRSLRQDLSPPSADNNVEDNSTQNTTDGNSKEETPKSIWDFNLLDLLGLGGSDMNVTKNKKLSYFGNGVQTVSSSELGKIVDKFEQSVVDINKAAKGFPPGYYDYITYPHRSNAYKFIRNINNSMRTTKSEEDIDKIFRIGDCYFVIPPEFITVSTISSHDSIQGIRHSGSIQRNHGHAQREIQVSLVLNGMDQINGHEVESPFDYPYYVDGLRTLISQFKYTPFLPIENSFLNLVHGIHAVALRNISVETIEGFPETLNVMISMQEFNLKSYINEDESIFGDIIDWDLYRYYIQQPLRPNHKNHLSKITTPALTSDFNFKILKQDALSGYKLDEYGNVKVDSNGNPITISKENSGYLEDDIVIDITKNKYYQEVLSDKDNIEFTGLNFSMGNIVPVIQMSAHEIPTAQYLGSTDTTFVLNFETTDQNVITKINEMNSQNLALIRDNREKSGIGFMKIDNELVKLTGTNFLLISSINVSTVPRFPGLYSITMECISYDSNQKESEKLIPLNPFYNRKGTEEDLISQQAKGISNKIKQDACIESKLMELEMYPDLCLPTYSEVDDAILKIREFRRRKCLTQQLNITRLPRTKSEMPGNKNEVEYSKYVDPDFYIMYTSKLSDITTSGNPVSKTQEIVSGAIRSTFTKESNGLITIDSSKFVTESHISELLSQCNGNLLDIFPFTQPKPDVAIEPQYAYGYEPNVKTRLNKSFLQNKESDPEENDSHEIYDTSSGSNNSHSVDPVSVKKKYGNPFVDLACDRADSKCGYVYGSDGQIYTQEMKSRLEKQYGYNQYNGELNSSQWLGRQVFDCSGLICWAMRKIGLQGSGFRIASGSFGSYGTKISANEIKPGDIFYDGKHCGICLEDGKTVEAKGTNYGVVYGTLNKSRYSFVRLRGLDEANRKFLSNNKNFYSGSSSSINTGTTQAPTTSNTTSSSNTGTLGRTILANFGGNNACDKWNKQILQISNELNLDPNFIKAIIRIESNGNPNAISSYDRPNIVGLMQVYLKYHKSKFNGTNYFDPLDNIRAGCRIWKSYGSADWVRYDLEKSICCYNAGPGAAKNIYSGSQAMPKETRNYIEKYKKYYKELMDKGGKPGNRITLTVGGTNISDIDNSDYSSSSSVSSNITYAESDFTNPNNGQKHGDSIDIIDINDFGKSSLTLVSSSNGKGLNDVVYDFSASSLGKKIKKLNSKKIIEWMFHDAVQYSNKGRLSRAFPAFLFVIADEQSDWIDRKKLWTNYYVYRSVIDINIHQSYDNPISTAKVTLTNFNNNLTKIYSKPTTKSLLEEGPTKWIYELTGAIINEEITDEMIKLKNMLRDEVYLYEGARVHIRMGYGSNPAKYPTNFNGTITNIEYGELISLVAQSDGIELVSHPLTDKSSQTNKDLGLPEEVSNMIARMFVARESDFLYDFTWGNFKINSKNGIEHFGIHYDTINWNSIDLSALLSEDQGQYDIVQNIYKGTYSGVPFSALSFLNFDGERNWRFFASGKTVWDIVKMCEKSMPEFIAYPRYFGFESRIFYGVPSWLYNYKYEIDKSTNDLYVRSKAFTQVHEASSVDSIIDNTITVDTRDLATNFIGTYTLGGDLATTPVIMSDHKIDWSRQKTRTIDTTSVQDFAWVPSLVDKFLSWTGTYDNGKELAIMTCVSELAISWKETYKGSLLILGQPEINAHDWVFVDDSVLRMNGMVSVREVIHSMSVSSGFTTSVIPGMIAINTLKNSGIENAFRSTLFVVNSFAHWKYAKFLGTKALSLVSKAITASKLHTYLKGAYSTVLNFTATKANDIYNMVKKGDAIIDTAKFIKKADALVDTAKGSKLFSIGKSAISVAKGTAVFTPVGLAALAAMIVADILIGWLITSIIDMFAYRNCMTLHPLIISMPNGDSKAYVGNVRGGRKILPMLNYTEDA